MVGAEKKSVSRHKYLEKMTVKKITVEKNKSEPMRTRKV